MGTLTLAHVLASRKGKEYRWQHYQPSLLLSCHYVYYVRLFLRFHAVSVYSVYAGMRPNFSRYCASFSSFTRTSSSSLTIFSDRIDTVSRSSWIV
jgi:hypothetical protein